MLPPLWKLPTLLCELTYLHLWESYHYTLFFAQNGQAKAFSRKMCIAIMTDVEPLFSKVRELLPRCFFSEYNKSHVFLVLLELEQSYPLVPGNLGSTWLIFHQMN